MPPAKPIAAFASDLAARLDGLGFKAAAFVRWVHAHHRVSIDEPTLSKMLSGTFKLDANLLPFLCLYLQRDPRTAAEAVDVVFGGLLAEVGHEARPLRSASGNAAGALHEVMREAAGAIRCAAEVIDPEGPGGFCVTQPEAVRARKALGTARSAIERADELLVPIEGGRPVAVASRS